MSQRTTIVKVKQTLTNDWDPKQNLQPFIDKAVMLTDKAVACALAKSLTLTADVVTDAGTTNAATMIETELAAHFYKYARDRQINSRGEGGVSHSYSGQTAMYLEGTTYGQNALSLDHSGCLQALAMGQQSKKARGTWLGRRPSQQTVYSDRD